MTWPALVAWVLDETLLSMLVVVHVQAAVDRRRGRVEQGAAPA